MVRLVVAPPQHGEVGDLEAVGGPAAALQGAGHRVPHVEVRLRHVRCQVKLRSENMSLQLGILAVCESGSPK